MKRFLLAAVLLGASSSLLVQGDGRLRIEARDRATGQLVAARMYLTDVSGAARTPRDVIAYDKRDEHHVIVTGALEFELPPGEYRLVVERGTESSGIGRPHDSIRSDCPPHHLAATLGRYERARQNDVFDSAHSHSLFV